MKNRTSYICNVCKSFVEVVGDKEFDCGVCAGRVVIHDGGRADADYKGHTGDCATRAIAISLNLSYQQVYDEITTWKREFIATTRSKKIKKYIIKNPNSSFNKTASQGGLIPCVMRKYMASKNWKWVSTMKIGAGCKVHLHPDELPSGILLCQVSKHLVCVIDGVVHDTYDSTRGGSRCVYGYYIKNEVKS